MTDLRSILLLLFLLPAISVAQTIHVIKEEIVYQGKLESHSPGKDDGYENARILLMNVVRANPDSLRENKLENELSSTASTLLPTPYSLVKSLHYKVKLKPGKEGIEYEIGEIYLTVRERGKKVKVISSAELLKGLQENGKTGMFAERELNEIDMNIQKMIAAMQASLRSKEIRNWQ